MKCVNLLEDFAYSKSSDGVKLSIIGKGDLHSLDQVLGFNKETGLEKLMTLQCPPLELNHLRMLTSLKTLIVEHSDGLVGPLGGQDDVERQLPVEHIKINGLNGSSGKELTELLPHFPKLSKLEIWKCKNIKQLVVGMDLQQTTSAASEEQEDDGVLLFPAHLFDSLRELDIYECPELVLVDPPTLVPGAVFQALQFLQGLSIKYCPKFLSTFPFSHHIFPSSLQFLELSGVEGMGTLEPLSNLSSLTRLELWNCGENLKCQGLRSLLTTGGQLKKLSVFCSPKFFNCWNCNPGWALEDVEGEEQQTHPILCTLWVLCTDDIAGFVDAPICSFLSSSLTELELRGYGYEGMERFSKEQEDALQLLSSLQKLELRSFHDLQQLPDGLCNLTSLSILSIRYCPAISSLANDNLPKSLQELDIRDCHNQELKEQRRGLVETVPKIELLD